MEDQTKLNEEVVPTQLPPLSAHAWVFGMEGSFLCWHASTNMTCMDVVVRLLNLSGVTLFELLRCVQLFAACQAITSAHNTKALLLFALTSVSLPCLSSRLALKKLEGLENTKVACTCTVTTISTLANP